MRRERFDPAGATRRGLAAAAAILLLAQGREYDNLVRVNGQWRFRKRQIVGGKAPPAGWPN